FVGCFVLGRFLRGGSVREQLEDDTGREEAAARRPAGHDAAELDGIELVHLAGAAALERPAGGAVEDEVGRLAVPLGPFGGDGGGGGARGGRGVAAGRAAGPIRRRRRRRGAGRGRRRP